MVPLNSASATVSRYRAVLCDIWGVLHDGITLYPGAVHALQTYRSHGGKVILLSNSPRPKESVREQLDGLKTPENVFDEIVTSGDATRSALARRPGTKVFHLGPERDRSLLQGIDIRPVRLADAEAVLCSGLFDDETDALEDYDGLLAKMHQLKLVMYCANPDRVVHRGDRLLYCAGALADRYRSLGGRVVLAGKPHSPIYRLAFDTLGRLCGESVHRSGILAIGDAVPTDLTGAAAAGLDCLFVTGGIHGAEIGTSVEDPEPDDVAIFIEKIQRQLPSLRLVGVISRLRW